MSSTETLTREDVQLSTGTDPNKCSHYILKREYLPGEPLEALCGHTFVPKQNPKGMPICGGCKAVYEDNEARSLAAGWRGPKDV